MLAELMADRGNWAQVMHGARACLFSLKNGPFPLTLRLEPLNRHNSSGKYTGAGYGWSRPRMIVNRSDREIYLNQLKNDLIRGSDFVRIEK